jgi:3-hydroxyisobutyrate dehydrogenase
MRSTARLLGQVASSRAKSISFVGMGRMGSEMAYNLFSKQIAPADSGAPSGNYRFVVCDAVPEAAARFADNFRKQFRGANVTVVANPKE